MKTKLQCSRKIFRQRWVVDFNDAFVAAPIVHAVGLVKNARQEWRCGCVWCMWTPVMVVLRRCEY